MKNILLSAVAALAVTAAAPALAADMAVKAPPMAAPAPPPPVFDIAIGGVVETDYNFRGVSQSNKGPSGGAYFEPDFTTPIGTLYIGVAGYAIDWPSGPGYGFSDPTAEIDLYGGWRNSWGPFSLDLGYIYYYYPRESLGIESDFWEIYGKASYEIVKSLTIGGNVFYTDDLLNYGGTGILPNNAPGVYASVTGTWVLPWTAGDVGAFISGELGHWWIDDTGFLAVGLGDPSYTYWNVGLGITYKALTLDLRYHGTDLGTTGCGNFLTTGVPNNSNNWCDDTFIAALKFDTTINSIK